mmetsp:Transcript_11292/g.17471  ORF Transcript_11292/g.17471 Transcript_11292/m.17471 type:complete len:398 (-) Transcript_11292:76-1269(-)
MFSGARKASHRLLLSYQQPIQRTVRVGNKYDLSQSWLHTFENGFTRRRTDFYPATTRMLPWNKTNRRHGSTQSPNKQENALSTPNNDERNLERLSKLISQQSMNMTMSRREAERLIRAGSVTISGKVVTDPSLLLSLEDATGQIKVDGKRVVLQEGEGSTGGSGNIAQNPTKVWLVHKLNGEVVAENDPFKRSSMIERLIKGGVGHRKGRSNWHLKPIGRLDMSTEGLILVTNDGKYAREMELPSNKVHRTYRVRLHGILTPSKLKAIRVGSVMKGNTRYPPMKVELERVHKSKQGSTNFWMRITCTEGKNRQIRYVMEQLGLKVTRLIRISVGDYQLQTIPPGMAVEIPFKAIEDQKRKGPLFPRNSRKKNRRHQQQPEKVEAVAPPEPVEWIRHV